MFKYFPMLRAFASRFFRFPSMSIDVFMSICDCIDIFCLHSNMFLLILDYRKSVESNLQYLLSIQKSSVRLNGLPSSPQASITSYPLVLCGRIQMRLSCCPLMCPPRTVPAHGFQSKQSATLFLLWCRCACSSLIKRRPGTKQFG